MPISPGEKLGPYEIIAPLGKGGMGEVYRAKDTKLDREVAIKVLPHLLAQDAERLARFEREAKVLASLNHPNIAQIYGIEERALVMELVPGNTLKGPVPLETALDYAKQIAEALEAAHEKGITHRDLKPANIMITPAGVVKVLDFGLAAVTQPSGTHEGDPSQSPTLTMRATQAGMIMGTAAYMSPEQARGKPVDKRADIWAFGVVLYEMLTGTRPFRGDTLTDVLAAVVKEEPKWDTAPARAQRLLRACLEKDPRLRLRDIGDARRLLDEGSPACGPRHRKLPWAIAATATLALAAALVLLWPRPVDRPLTRFSVDLGPDAALVAGVNGIVGGGSTVAISPDGRRIAYIARGTGGRLQLASRLLDQPQAALLANTDGAGDPFYSPDGKWIGFFADGKLQKMSLQGGVPVVLCDASNSRGASWGDDGTIVAALTNTQGLSRVPDSGGVPQPLTQFAANEVTHRWPQFLPGAEAVLFTASTNIDAYEGASIDAVSLKTGQRKTVVTGGYFGRYLPTNGSTGHLVYVRQGGLYGVPFDPARLELLGTPARVLDDVAGDAFRAAGQFDFSSSPTGPGTFVYLRGTRGDQIGPVDWLESSGKTEPLIATAERYFNPRVSPDGERLAVSLSSGKGTDLFVYDRRRDTRTRLTFTAQDNLFPVWAPDRRHLVFGQLNSGIWWIRADGAGEAQRVLESKKRINPYSFSPDGKLLLYEELNSQTGFDLWILPLDLSDPERPKPGKPEPFLRTPSAERFPAFSPDGRWVAYSSIESGSFEVYVRPYLAPAAGAPGGKWQISNEGGIHPIWSPKGGELFFQTPDQHIMTVRYTVEGDSFVSERPRLWSETRILDNGYADWDVAPDGKRLVIFPRPEPTAEQKGSVHVTVLLNFFDELRRRVPTGK